MFKSAWKLESRLSCVSWASSQGLEKQNLTQEVIFLHAPYFFAAFVHMVTGIGETNSALQDIVHHSKPCSSVSHLLAWQCVLLEESWFVVPVPSAEELSPVSIL